MFDKIFTDQKTIQIHLTGPFVKLRVSYLRLCQEKGYRRNSLRCISRFLLWLSIDFKCKIDKKKRISNFEIHDSGEKWLKKGCGYRKKKSKKRHLNFFIRQAALWFKYMNLFNEINVKTDRIGRIVNSYIAYSSDNSNYSKRTIETRIYWINAFLNSYFKTRRQLRSIKIDDIDAFFAECFLRGFSKVTVSNIAGALRSFLRQLEKEEKISSNNFSAMIASPRIYSDHFLPQGPKWSDVHKILQSCSKDTLVDTRDKAMIMLITSYGLRASEVAKLRLEDLDWDNERLTIQSAKTNRRLHFTITHNLGNLIIKYLKYYRPKIKSEYLFISIRAPYRPITFSSVSSMVQGRMKRLNIDSPSKGPHSIRHAFATHLLSKGVPIIQISNILGHANEDSTKKYAKVNLQQLRIVADFNFGGVL